MGKRVRRVEARHLMQTEVLTVRENDTVERVIALMIDEHIHGAPVVDAAGMLVGVVTQQDLFIGGMAPEGATKATRRGRAAVPRVRDIMTSPAVSADEKTDVRALCRLMHRLRIHRVPVVAEGRVTGILSSLDVCAAVADGRLG